MTATRQFYLDVMTTGLEGGINYWALARNVSRNEEGEVTGFYVKPDEPSFEDGDIRDDWQLIEAKNIRSALERVIAGELGIGSHWVDAIKLGNRENDASYIDAECADILIQVAAFGEVVFS